MAMREKTANHKSSSVPASDANHEPNGKADSEMIDLNSRPVRTHGQASNSQVWISKCFSFSKYLDWPRLPMNNFKSGTPYSKTQFKILNMKKLRIHQYTLSVY